MPPLHNPRHEIFAQELAKGKSQGEAYALAGFKPSEQHACRLAKHGKVAARVSELHEAAAKRTGASIESVIAELLCIAEADIGEAVEWNGETVTVLDSKSLPQGVRRAISEVRKTRDGVAIKFHSKTSALEMLGRYLGMFRDRVEHSGPGGGPIETRELSPLEAGRRIAFALEKARRELESASTAPQSQ
jgi:phage terminase small subunit